MLKAGEEYLFYGKITEGGGYREMLSPVFAKPSVGEVIHPIYSQVAGLTTKQIEASVKQALVMLPEVIVDPIPDYIRYKYDLAGIKSALTKIHFPKNMEDVKRARRRLRRLLRFVGAFNQCNTFHKPFRLIVSLMPHAKHSVQTTALQSTMVILR